VAEDLEGHVIEIAAPIDGSDVTVASHLAKATRVS